MHLLQAQRLTPVQFTNTKMPFFQGQVFASLGENRLLALSQDHVWLVKSDDKGATWQAQPFFSEEQLSQHPEMRVLYSIHVGPKGDLWMGCSRSLCRYDRGAFTVFGKKDGLPGEEWGAIHHDRQGTLWLRGNQHIYVLQSGANVFVDRSPPQEGQEKSGRVALLMADANDRMFSQQDSGLIRWSGKAWQSFDESNGLTIGGGINSILIDRDNGVWLGSVGRGLIHWLGYPNLENWTTEQGLPNNVVLSFLRDQDHLFHIGTRSGSAVQTTPRHFSVVEGRYGKTSHQWNSMVQDGKGRIWAGTLSGVLVRREPGSKQDILVAKLAMINNLFFDRAGQLWISTDRGLYVIRHPEADAKPLIEAEFSSIMGGPDVQVFRGCQSSSGTLWFLSSKGVQQFDGGRWRNLQLSPAAPEAELSTMTCSNDGTLWIGSMDGGLWHAAQQGNALKIDEATPALLQGKEIGGLIEDSRGWLWMATGNGVAVWNRKQWRFLNQESGVVWDDIDPDALYEDHDGSIWIGTSNGASHILHPETLFSSFSLEVLVESDGGDGRLPGPTKSIRLPWTSGPLNFKFAVLSYQNRETVQFHYRMKGLEQDWSTTTVPEVRYPALPPGRYTLQVTADNVSMQTSSPTTEVKVEILPPWWRTTVFYTACGVFLTILLFVADRYRVRRLLARQRLKGRQARERAYELELSREEERRHLTREIHDELGQYLSALRMGVSVVGMEFGEKNPSLQGKVQRLVSLVDGTIKVVRNIVSALRPGALDLGVVSALEWLAEEFTENTGIRCLLHVREEKITLDEKRATTIFRIAQESLTNVGRHAEASRVDITLERQENRYLLEIRDNGKGFDPDLRKKKSFGLIGIRERAFMLGGDANIISVAGAGTTIRVFIPIDGACQAQ
ncbi:MAG: two-component regulator propeller domain-containing protein [Collimonas sp.]|uniref:sensor histidine kinase n=1 Tax=Collimonas sp. TaxID=1963772 RepID=UPI003265660E